MLNVQCPMSTIEILVPHRKYSKYSLELSKLTQSIATKKHSFSSTRRRQKKQLYRQSAHTEGQKEMLFRGLSMGEFSWFKRISSSFYSKNLLLYDRIAILILVLLSITLTYIDHYKKKHKTYSYCNWAIPIVKGFLF